MSRNLIDDEVPQLVKLRERWLQLPLPYRLNALMYFLGACALLFLLSTLVLGGDNEPRPVQVGAGVAPTTTVARPRPSASIADAPLLTTTSSPGASSSSSSSVVATTLQPAPSGGGGGGGGGTAPTVPGTTVAPATTSPPTTAEPATTTTAPCRNSQEARCGNFVWDPPAGPNEPLSVNVSVRPNLPRVGEAVTFDVVVEDPDHLVGLNCSEVRFGDGGTANGPCSSPPECPPRHGPWTPPARRPGHFATTYSHVYQGAGIVSARFVFKSWNDICLGLDPYASVGEREVLITIAPAGA